MFKTTLRIAVLAVAVSAPLLAVGCASNTADKPYSVTGNSVDAQESKERMRWTDDKGHYRQELRGQGGTALRDVP